MNINIRQATIEDVNDISVLFDQYRMFYNQKSDLEEARKFIFDRLAQRESIIFVAKEIVSNKTVGFAQLYPCFSSISMKRSFILNDLFVHEEYRNQGIAKALLEAVRSYGIIVKAKGIELATSIHNENAQSLYESNHYQKDLDFYHYYLDL